MIHIAFPWLLQLPGAQRTDNTEGQEQKVTTESCSLPAVLH